MNLLPVLLFACVAIGVPRGPGSTPSSEPTLEATVASAGAKACFEHSAEACTHHEECEAILGRALTPRPEGPCVDYSRPLEPMGCMAAGFECGEAITLAAPAAEPERCRWFPSTCLPKGWTVCAALQVPECPSAP